MSEAVEEFTPADAALAQWATARAEGLAKRVKSSDVVTVGWDTDSTGSHLFIPQALPPVGHEERAHAFGTSVDAHVRGLKLRARRVVVLVGALWVWAWERRDGEAGEATVGLMEHALRADVAVRE